MVGVISLDILTWLGQPTIMHQSIPSGNIPPGNPGVLHLLSARVLGFVPSRLPGGCPGVGSIICDQSTKLLVNAV